MLELIAAIILGYYGIKLINWLIQVGLDPDL
jgi:hypothetical protein